MLLMLKHVVIPISDLQQLVLKCPQCSTEIPLALDDKGTSKLDQMPAGLYCPVCAKDLPSTLKGSIDQFRHAHQALVVAAEIVTGVRIKADEPTARPAAASTEA
jgi:hypothetical protein